MAYLQSSQNFVRALKAPSDPPSAGSPTKIDIAFEAWNDGSSNIQNKAEAIVEFILTRLLKEKTKTTDSPIIDKRYWNLLSLVISSLQLSASLSVSIKPWLLPLLKRVPLVPICTALLERSNEEDPPSAVEVLYHASRAIATLWPLASPKFTSDVLLDCFGALLSAAARFPHESSGLMKLGGLVCASLQEAFSNSSNKKKLHQTFTSSHLQRWVVCIAHLKEESGSTILTDLYHTGREILFNADTLKNLSEPSFVKALLASLPLSEASLKALPKLLHSFAVAARKNRALFGQGASAPTAARAVSMLFLAHCADYVRSAPSDLFEAACNARLGLLRVVEAESLLGFGQTDSQQAIRREVGFCISSLPLDNTSANSESSILLDCLCVASRIDHDLLEPHLAELLPRLLAIPPQPHPAATSASELLALCISYNSRARSLPVLSNQVQTVLESLASAQGSIREMYPRAAGSPLLAQGFLKPFAKAVQTYITPGQVLSTAQDIVASLEHAYETFEALAARSAGYSGLGPRKKARRSRASTGGDIADASALDAAAVSFSFLARGAACILPALPIQTVTADVQEEVRECIHRANFAKDDLIRTEMTDGGDEQTDSWAPHIVLAAALRLVYALQSAPRLRLPPLQKELKGCVILIHQRSSLLPELLLETSRYLVQPTTFEEPIKRGLVLTRILAFLGEHLKMPQAWNGRSAELAYGDEGASQAATGLLRLVLDRFIHVFDVAAHDLQLEQLAELLTMAAACPARPTDVLTPSLVAKECLRSAQLWEQRRLRKYLLASITSRLQVVDAVHAETVISAAPHTLTLANVGLRSDMLDRALEGFHLLLYCPTEYLSKSLRADTLRRAVILDMTLTAIHRAEGKDTIALKVVRTFLQRTFGSLGAAEHQYAQAYLESLVQSVAVDGADEKVTLEIIDIHVRTVFRTAHRDFFEFASRFIASLLPLQPKQSSPDVDGRMDTLRERLMSVLTRDLTASSLPGELKASLHTFQEHMSARIQTLADALATGNGAPKDGSVVTLASAYLRFSSWLGVEVSSAPLKATDLVKALASSNYDPSQQTSHALGASIFGLLVAEFECKAVGREDRLAELLASYVALNQMSESSDIKSIDSMLLGATRRLSVGEFAASLDLVEEMLRDEQVVSRLSGTVRLGSVLLRGAPEGTLKTTQAFFTRALCTFVDYPHYTSNHLLRAQALDFLDQQCCERPASLRLINLTIIWPLLARILGGTSTRDGHGSSAVFHRIVSIVGALVRLRRDLIVNTLPHLCITLRMLVSSLRSPRPNLGGKQRSVVADSLPAWVDLDHPLGAEEGRALARLMTTLATKTAVRVHASSSEPQKAESLARPLSKHVAYVIQAYLGAVNDPLCVMPLPVRQELMPGLFVLCGMLNEHDRDALMVSGLDAAGKATLKALWKDYEKQRYVGKG